MEKFTTFKESFDYFNAVRDPENEYYSLGKRIGIEEEKIYTGRLNTFHFEDLVLDVKKFDHDHRTKTVVEKYAVERFHPQKINNKDFWMESRKNFPFLSVCGSESSTIEDVNRLTLGFSNTLGLLPFLKDKIIHSKKISNVLEIGFGYGNIFYEIKDLCNYYGIDYVLHDSLKKYHNFIEIGHSGIPDIFLNENLFDIVYCINVLQHCSQQDRFTYFKQAYESLKPGGYFIFTEFLMTEENKDKSCWGIVDADGRAYTQFFNQLTECDTHLELSYIMRVLDFKILGSAMSWENNLAMIVQK